MITIICDDNRDETSSYIFLYKSSLKSSPGGVALVGRAVPLRPAAAAPRGPRQLRRCGGGTADAPKVEGEQLADAGDTGECRKSRA